MFTCENYRIRREQNAMMQAAEKLPSLLFVDLEAGERNDGPGSL